MTANSALRILIIGAAGNSNRQLGLRPIFAKYLHNPRTASCSRICRPYSSSTYSRVKEVDMADEQQQQPPAPAPVSAPPSVDDLPPETIAFASRMFDAARQGNSEILTQAIKAGLPVNLTNDKGNTLLMLAAYAGHASVVESLLRDGADPNRLNDNLQSPLAGVVFKGHDGILRVLLDAGADPRLGKPSAIETAYMFGKQSLLQVLGAKEGEVGPEVPMPPVMMAGKTASE